MKYPHSGGAMRLCSPSRSRATSLVSCVAAFVLFVSVVLPASLALSGEAGASSSQDDCPTNVWAGSPVVPRGLEHGDEFRLMFISSGKRDANEKAHNISPYNEFIQNSIRSSKLGGTSIFASSGYLRNCADDFRAVVSTAAKNARQNTQTRNSDTGKPIYWVDGKKIADDYDDFWDGTWDSYQLHDEHGKFSYSYGEAWTGTWNNGYANEGYELGSTYKTSRIEHGNYDPPSYYACDPGPLTDDNGYCLQIVKGNPKQVGFGDTSIGQSGDRKTMFINTASGQHRRSLYGLSPIFRVAGFAEKSLAAVSVVMDSAVRINPPTLSATPAGVVTYSVSPRLPAGLSLDTTTGVISGTVSSSSARRTYTVTATDSAHPDQNDSFTVSIQVRSMKFSQLTLGSNDIFVGSDIRFNPPSLQRSVGTVTYSVSPKLPAGLSLDQATGVISGMPTRAKVGVLYTVTATDSASSPQQASFTIRMSVKALTFAKQELTEVLTDTNSDIRIEPPQLPQQKGRVTYSASPKLPAGLSLNQATGVISGRPTESSAATRYTITATSKSGPWSGSASFYVKITVTDLGFARSDIGHFAGTTGTKFQIYPQVPHNDLTVLRWSVSPQLPAGLSIRVASGMILGTPTEASPQKEYTVTVTELSSIARSASYTLTIGVEQLSFATSSLGQIRGTVGSALRVTPPKLSHAEGKVVYSLQSTYGYLPDGLTLNPRTGVISGEPTTEFYSYSGPVRVTATDSSDVPQTASFSVSFRIDGMYFVPEIAYRRWNYSTIGSTLTVNPPKLLHAVGAVTYSVAPTLPAGLSLDPATGVISGRPTETSSKVRYTFTATDSSDTPQQATSFEIYLFVMGFAETNLADVSTPVGSDVTIDPPMLEGGSGKAEYSVSPQLPSGLVLDAATGVISGRPTHAATATTYTVTARTPNQAASFTTSITVTPPIQFGWLDTGHVLASVGSDLQITPPPISNAVGAVTYSVAPTLPAGLSLDPATGVISGRPSEPTPNDKPVWITVTATDSSDSPQSSSFMIRLEISAIGFRKSTLGSVSTSLGSDLTIEPPGLTHATGEVTYTIQPALPKGLSLNPETGVISARDAKAMAATSFTVTATDSSASPQSASFTVDIEVRDEVLKLSAKDLAGSDGLTVRLSVSSNAPSAVVAIRNHGEPRFARFADKTSNPIAADTAPYSLNKTVVGLIPCSKYTIYLVHLPSESMTNKQLRKSWKSLTERSDPLEIWTKSRSESACDGDTGEGFPAPNQPNLSSLVSRRAVSGSDTRAWLKWQNPGGVETVVVIFEGPPNSATHIERLAQTPGSNPRVAGSNQALLIGLKPCTVYYARVHEKHPAFNPVDDQPQMYRGAMHKTNKVKFKTTGCDQ